MGTVALGGDDDGVVGHDDGIVLKNILEPQSFTEAGLVPVVVHHKETKAATEELAGGIHPGLHEVKRAANETRPSYAVRGQKALVELHEGGAAEGFAEAHVGTQQRSENAKEGFEADVPQPGNDEDLVGLEVLAGHEEEGEGRRLGGVEVEELRDVDASEVLFAVASLGALAVFLVDGSGGGDVATGGAEHGEERVGDGIA